MLDPNSKGPSSRHPYFQFIYWPAGIKKRARRTLTTTWSMQDKGSPPPEAHDVVKDPQRLLGGVGLREGAHMQARAGR